MIARAAIDILIQNMLEYMLVDLFYDYDENSTKIKLTQDFGEIPSGFISDRGISAEGNVAE